MYQKLQNLGEFVDFAEAFKQSRLSISKRFSIKGAIIGDMDEMDAQKQKFSNIINKKFNELMGRKSSSLENSNHSVVSNPSVISSQSAPHSSCNLDHIIADDAVSINSGSDNDNDDIDIDKMVANRNQKGHHRKPNEQKHGNRPSISSDTLAPSIVTSDLP